MLRITYFLCSFLHTQSIIYILLKKYFSLFHSFFSSLFLPKCNQKEARVAAACKEKNAILRKNVKLQNLRMKEIHILIVAYKHEKELEIYVKMKSTEKYQKLITYPICARSGGLGPKRKEGDLQVPEGFYYIERFNPLSIYHLSLGINYPNEADKRKSNAPKLGNDIFIHGECITTGCLPMTNDKIKEIYLYALAAKENGQSNIPVYIFPFKFSAENVAKFRLEYAENPDLWAFWENLQQGYSYFQENLKELNVMVNENGDYVFERYRS